MSIDRNLLYKKSLQIILENQDSTGSFPASPTFPHFRYCWIRDGLFTAHGALISGHADVARRFYLWVNNTLLKHQYIVSSLAEKIQAGTSLVETDFLPARFTMDGEIEPATTDKIPFYYKRWPQIYSLKGISEGNKWPNFQTDCYGAWLWGISAYANHTKDFAILDECKDSISLTIDYLKMTWEMPCFDPWEEYGQERAIGTLGSIGGGLIAINEFLKETSIADWIKEIRSALRDSAKDCGYLPKYIGSDEIDASSIWLFTPFNVFDANDPLTEATITRVREKLLVGGGVKRYLKDVYFGGGEWIILTCWLAWHDINIGNLEEAEALIQWCESHTEKDGLFPEQSLEHLNYPEFKDVWEKNWWHESPAPLLWAHGMYIIACDALSKLA